MNDVMQDIGRLKVGDFVIASFDRTEGRNPRKWTEAGELQAKFWSLADSYGNSRLMPILFLRSTIDGRDQVVRSSDGSPGGWLKGLILLDPAEFGAIARRQRLEMVRAVEEAKAEEEAARAALCPAQRRLFNASEAAAAQQARLDAYDGKIR